MYTLICCEGVITHMEKGRKKGGCYALTVKGTNRERGWRKRARERERWEGEKVREGERESQRGREGEKRN